MAIDTRLQKRIESTHSRQDEFLARRAEAGDVSAMRRRGEEAVPLVVRMLRLQKASPLLEARAKIKSANTSGGGTYKEERLIS